MATLASWLDEDSLRSRVCVLAIVVLLHGVFFRMLGYGHDRPWLAPAQDSVLRVEFIERAPRRAEVMREPVEDRPAMAAAEVRTATAAGKARQDQPAMPGATVGVALPAQAPEPLALEWQSSSQVEPGFQPNIPEENVAFPTELNGPDRIRMRRQVSGQDVVEGAAQLLGFWPAGYESDPCPRVKRNISGLMTDTRPQGREALSEELRRQRVACRQ